MDAIRELDVGSFNARSILNLLPDGAYMCDMDRRIIFWNDAAMRITGWRAEEVVGRHCRDNVLVHVDNEGHPLCGRELCPLHRSMVTGNRSSRPLLVFALHREGHRVPVEVTVAPLRNPQGEVVGGIEIFRDLTDTFQDLEHASRVQRHVLKAAPGGDPRLNFSVQYSPAGLVGGDFYRAERLGDSLYAVMIADVSGHGVSAALHCMQICALWEEFRGLLPTPGAFLSAVGKSISVLAADLDRFATALFATLNPDTGELIWANAGHPEGYVLGDAGPVRLEATGPGLGLVPEFVYENSSATLPRGGGLLLCTDGAIEPCAPNGEELGSEGLLELVRKCRSPDGGLDLAELEIQIHKATGAIRLPDDLTLLFVHRP